jgi:hypothetical protein
MNRILLLWLLWLPLLTNAQTLHLHLNNSALVPGDTLWFSGYAPATVSDTTTRCLYADLVDIRQRVIVRRSFRMREGVAPGYLPLSDTLLYGPYRLRVFTPNSAALDRYASELFWLTRPNSRLQNPPPAPDSTWTLTATPEGGPLVENLPATVVVRVADENTQGIATTVSLLDDQQNGVAEVKTDSRGWGRLFFTPLSGRTYAVRVGALERTRTMLPKAGPTGIRLSVDGVSVPDGFRVKVFRGRVGAASTLWLRAFVGDSLCFVSADSSAEAVLSLRVPKTRFPAGVVRFQLSDHRDSLLVERLAWGQYPTTPTLTVSFLPTGAASCPDLAQIRLALVDETGQPIAGRVSVAITDSLATAYDEPNRATGLIRRYLPQTSAERFPAGYLIPAAARSLDMLLATAQEPFRVTEPNWVDSTGSASDGLMVEGTALDEANKPLPNASLLVTEYGRKLALSITADERGYFSLNLPNQTDTLSLGVQRFDAKNRSVPTNVRWFPISRPAFRQEGGFPALYRQGPLAVFATDTLVKFTGTTTLEAVSVKARRQLIREYYVADYSQEVDEKLLDRFGQASALSLVNQLLRFEPGFSRLAMRRELSRLKEEQLTPRSTAWKLPAPKMKTDLESSLNQTMDFTREKIGIPVLIDRFLYTNPDNAFTRLSAMPAIEVERIEIVRTITKNVIYADGFPPGPGQTVIAVITRSGQFGNKRYPIASQTAMRKLPGYTLVPPFRPNLRRSPAAVYWNPSLTINAQGQATICLPGLVKRRVYHVVIEGYTAAGMPVSGRANVSLP